nr:hypothetical protein [Desulfobacteraceae bacterium]
LTMFEWGMYQLKIDIDDYLGGIIGQNTDSEKKEKKTLEYVMGFSDFYTYVSYDWNKQRINLRIVLINKDEKLSIISKKDLCKKHTESIKKHFYTTSDPEIRKEYGISKFFKHSHFTKKNKPDDFQADIENIVEIRIDIQYTKNIFLLKESDYEIVTSLSPLMGDYIFFKENTDKPEESDDTKKSDETN